MSTYVRTYTHTCIHYIHTRTYIHTHARPPTHLHTHIHTYIHTYIHTFIHTYIHTYIYVRTAVTSVVTMKKKHNMLLFSNMKTEAFHYTARSLKHFLISSHGSRVRVISVTSNVKTKERYSREKIDGSHNYLPSIIIML